MEEVFKNEPGYHGWFLNADFPLYTKQCLRKEINRIKDTKSPKDFDSKLDALKNKFK